MDKRFLLILAACAVLLGGLFVFTKDKSSTSSSSGNKSRLSNHVYGEGKSGVKLLEYGDFQCPACGAYFPIVKEVKEKYKDQIYFQFRHFPLSQIHPNARAASRSAEAAGKQGKFWEMHDMLYETQSSWEGSSAAVAIFESYAKQIGLNIQKYKTDFASSEVNEIINADFAEGQKLGVEGTPTFYLEGKEITEKPQDIEGFSKLIDQAIANKAKKQ